MAWLWNTQLTSVAMIGLGGGSTQRAFEFYYPDVKIETAEIDPLVVQVARQFFDFKESDRQKVQVSDGCVFVRHNTEKHVVIILDSYIQVLYERSFLSQLDTIQFFVLIHY